MAREELLDPTAGDGDDELDAAELARLAVMAAPGPSGDPSEEQVASLRAVHQLLDEPLVPPDPVALQIAQDKDTITITSSDLLVRVAGGVGLNEDEARTLLASDRFAEEVRAREQFYLQQGIHSVPAIVINDRHLLQGGQPVEVFEQALRQIAAAEDFAI